MPGSSGYFRENAPGCPALVAVGAASLGVNQHRVTVGLRDVLGARQREVVQGATRQALQLRQADAVVGVVNQSRWAAGGDEGFQRLQ